MVRIDGALLRCKHRGWPFWVIDMLFCLQIGLQIQFSTTPIRVMNVVQQMVQLLR